MTDAEIAEFMGWSQQATDRMRDDPDSFISRVHRLVAEVQRRERLGQSMQDAMQDAVTAGVGIMRGGKRIDLASIYKQAEPKSPPCPTPGAGQWLCCGGWCGHREEAKA